MILNKVYSNYFLFLVFFFFVSRQKASSPERAKKNWFGNFVSGGDLLDKVW